MAASTPQGFFVKPDNVQFDAKARFGTLVVIYNRNPGDPLPLLPFPDASNQAAMQIFHEHPDDTRVLEAASDAGKRNDLQTLKLLMSKVHMCEAKLSICKGWGEMELGPKTLYNSLLASEIQKDAALYHRILTIYQQTIMK